MNYAGHEALYEQIDGVAMDIYHLRSRLTDIQQSLRNGETLVDTLTSMWVERLNGQLTEVYTGILQLESCFRK